MSGVQIVSDFAQRITRLFDDPGASSCSTWLANSPSERRVSSVIRRRLLEGLSPYWPPAYTSRGEL